MRALIVDITEQSQMQLRYTSAISANSLQNESSYSVLRTWWPCGWMSVIPAACRGDRHESQIPASPMDHSAFIVTAYVFARDRSQACLGDIPLEYVRESRLFHAVDCNLKTGPYSLRLASVTNYRLNQTIFRDNNPVRHYYWRNSSPRPKTLSESYCFRQSSREATESQHQDW